METAQHIEIIHTEYGDTILLNTETQRRLRLNKQSLYLFQLSKKHTDLNDITAKYNSQVEQTVGKDEVQRILEQLAKFGASTNTFKISAYLLVHTKLIPAKFVNRISAVLSKCIPANIRWFYYVFFALTALSSAFFIKEFSQEALKPAAGQLPLHAMLLIAIFIIHEFGHAAAAVKHGARPKEIGFGFYLLTPAFYCNLSDIWRLTPAKRNVVNLSGIYFQLLISLLLITVQLIYPHPVIKTLTLLNFILVFINLNPLLKYDGYWVVSDLFNVPNLRKSSFAALTKIITARGRGITGKKWALSVYAILSLAFIAYFLFYFVVPNATTIGLFPAALVKHVIDAFTALSFTTLFTFLKTNVLSVVFYYMVINILYGQYLKQKLKKQIEKV